ncbi:DUF1931 family protein [Streptomyces yatensis]|nr:DUF1931 family protein [Streptomyces yatensis]
MGVSKFERFFRAAAGLDVDRNDLKRYGDFVDAKVYDLLVVGQAPAKANGRDTVEPWASRRASTGSGGRRGGRGEADPGTARRAPSPRQDAHPGDRRPAAVAVAPRCMSPD